MADTAAPAPLDVLARAMYHQQHPDTGPDGWTTLNTHSRAAWRRAAQSWASAGDMGEPAPITGIRGMVSLLADLTDCSMRGELGTEELCRRREELIDLLRALGYTTGGDRSWLSP